jgi:hypothetical protein
MKPTIAAWAKLHGTRRGGRCGRPANLAGAHKGRPYVMTARGRS